MKQSKSKTSKSTLVTSFHFHLSFIPKLYKLKLSLTGLRGAWKVLKQFSIWLSKDHLKSLIKLLQLFYSIIPPWKGIWILESRKFLRVEFEVLGCGIRNKAEGIRNPTNDWNPESKFHWQRIRKTVPGIWNPRSGVQSKIVLDSLTLIKMIRATFPRCAYGLFITSVSWKTKIFLWSNQSRSTSKHSFGVQSSARFGKQSRLSKDDLTYEGTQAITCTYRI